MIKKVSQLHGWEPHSASHNPVEFGGHGYCGRRVSVFNLSYDHVIKRLYDLAAGSGSCKSPPCSHLSVTGLVECRYKVLLKVHVIL